MAAATPPRAEEVLVASCACRLLLTAAAAASPAPTAAPAALLVRLPAAATNATGAENWVGAQRRTQAQDPCSGNGITLRDSGLVAHTELRINDACTWTLLCSNTTKAPSLTWSTFETERSFDVVFIYDGNRATGTPHTVLSGSIAPGSSSCEGQPSGGTASGAACTDDPAYRDPVFNDTCSGWADYSCFEQNFLDAAQADNLRAACPNACRVMHLGQCGPRRDPSGVACAEDADCESLICDAFAATGSAVVLRYLSDSGANGAGFTAAFSCVEAASPSPSPSLLPPPSLPPSPPVSRTPPPPLPAEDDFPHSLVLLLSLLAFSCFCGGLALGCKAISSALKGKAKQDEENDEPGNWVDELSDAAQACAVAGLAGAGVVGAYTVVDDHRQKERRFDKYTYAGRGTRVLQHLHAREQPRNDLDYAALRHDMDYIQTQWAADRGRITQEEAVRKIRRADERLRNDIDSIRNRSVQFNLLLLMMVETVVRLLRQLVHA